MSTTGQGAARRSPLPRHVPARSRVGEGVIKVEDSGARMAAIESGASSVAALASRTSESVARFRIAA